jgi:hypothetical protein
MSGKTVMFLGIVGLLVLSYVLPLQIASEPPAAATPSIINDVSWPNCMALDDLISNAVGVIGVGGGLDFRPNPCLAQENQWLKLSAVYANTGYPGLAYAKKYMTSPQLCSSTNEQCLAYNYGYNAALYAINYAVHENVRSNQWWLDVETDNSWSNNVIYNRAALSGMVNAIHASFPLVTVGFYSYPEQWDVITGTWLNSYPVWVATGTESYQTAGRACEQDSFTGGPIIMTQFTLILDENYICDPAYFNTLSNK